MRDNHPPGCIADLLGPMAKRPGYNGCPCPACRQEQRPAPVFDAKMAQANDHD